jgi:hypothetical protein
MLVSVDTCASSLYNRRGRALAPRHSAGQHNEMQVQVLLRGMLRWVAFEGPAACRTRHTMVPHACCGCHESWA